LNPIGGTQATLLALSTVLGLHVKDVEVPVFAALAKIKIQ